MADRPAAAARILVVDDEPMTRALVERLLSKLGHHVQTAVDGEEAVATLASQPFDLVVMDCQMPRFDGFRATRAIRDSEASGSARRVTIIGLSGRNMEGDREAALEQGMDDYLTKPVSAARLSEALDRWAAADSDERDR